MEEKKYDLTIVYDYKERPDIVSGRCDNCGNAQFKSSMKNTIFLRECRECGMKKSI
ncbi:hypothetical protein [Bacillus lumedeiriae]|uniref:hypothetical protein n=1 Tax=Bacillus lumedeiriae TaxID=3058829 RepID=UPI00384AFCC8